MITSQMLPNPGPRTLYDESTRLARSVHAPRTLKGYASDWSFFLTWCEKNQHTPLPATSETIALYVTDYLSQGRKIKTMRRHLSAILHFHKQAGHNAPGKNAHEVLIGAQRLRGEQPQQKAAITVEQLREMVTEIARPQPYASRDRALLVFGFSTALRRSSIVALNLEDIEFGERGMIVNVRKEKQDQTGLGRRIGIPPGEHPETCPVRTLLDWIGWRGTDPGPLFHGLQHGGKVTRMAGGTVSTIVKRAIRSIGLDPAKYAGHSLRAGLITASLESGAGEILTARHSGHKNLGTLKQYMRSEDPFKANVCDRIGL